MTMRVHSVPWLILTLVALVRTANASPINIDFEELQVNDALIHFVGPVYSSNGFTFTASVPPNTSNTPGFNTVGTASSSFYDSTPLYNLNGFGGTTLTRSNGRLFDLLAIDLAETPNFDSFGSPINLGSFTLTFFGTRADGSTVQTTATISPFPAVTTFKFAAFTNLVSVQWFQGGGGASGLTHQFDNVRVQAVPEPNTLVFGLGAFIALRLRRRVVGHSGMMKLRESDTRAGTT